MAAPTRMLLPYRSGLVGYWPLCEGGGIIAHDLSPMGNHGTLLPPASEPTWTVGKLGKALSFDGTDDYVDCGNNTVLAPSVAMSMCAWVYPTLTTTQQYIIGKDDDSARCYGLYWQGNTFLCDFFIAGIGSATCFSSAFPLNNYYFVFASYDGNNAKLYVNGSLVMTSGGPSGSIVTSSDSLVIGRRNYPGYENYFEGVIDEVRIYNRDLTAEEVLDEFFSAVRGWP